MHFVGRSLSDAIDSLTFDKSIVVMIVGPAGSGKTTLVREIIRQNSFAARVEGPIAWLENSSAIVLGRWQCFHADTNMAGRLDGTDRIHASAVKTLAEKVEAFIAKEKPLIIAEGSRLLFYRAFLDTIRGLNCDVVFISLSTDPAVAKERVFAREGNSSAQLQRQVASWTRRFERMKLIAREKFEWFDVTQEHAMYTLERLFARAGRTDDPGLHPSPCALPKPPQKWVALDAKAKTT